jgi:N-formylglutamate amidohydrolase
VGPWWTLQRSDDCVLATAIHDGSELRPDVAEAMLLPSGDRLREEDPFTGHAIRDVPTHVIPWRSRFEVDLNRPEAEAVYRTPTQSWGLNVWREPPGDNVVNASLRLHRAFYAMLGQLVDEIAESHGRFVVLDVHSYNHRRSGPDDAPTPPEEAPEVNIGTFSMPRAHWSFLVDPLIEAMRDFDFDGRHLDVRENIAFQGRGELTRFVHQRHPRAGCAIAIEFKKFYMDEWSAIPDARALAAMRRFMRHVADVCRTLLDG